MYTGAFVVSDFLSIFITEQSVIAVAEQQAGRLACKATFAEDVHDLLDQLKAGAKKLPIAS